MPEFFVIPDKITVHLGPPDAPALNATLYFADYIKNVASGGICPLWPENAIRAIIYTQLSFALSRLYSAFYRGSGYDFDITGDAEYDQDYKRNRCVFENINRFADEMADTYITCPESAAPLDVRYTAVSGTDGSGEGLTSDLALRLAGEGKSPLEILRGAFGGDVYLKRGETADGRASDLPSPPLSLGMRGHEVADLQRKLNLISTSFPNIPKINPSDGMFGPGTDAALREFQRTFNLPDDGIAGRATLCRIRLAYETVRNMLRLNMQRMAVPANCVGKNCALTEGDKGDIVKTIQNLLNLASLYTGTVKPVPSDGEYGRGTTESVVDFQRTYGLQPTGDVDRETYNMLSDVFHGIEKVRSVDCFITEYIPYKEPGLRFGMKSEEVRRLQKFINRSAEIYGNAVGKVGETGVFGSETRTALRALQRIHRLPQTGAVGAADWEMLTSLNDDCAAAIFLAPGQYPGYLLERKPGKEARY